MRDEIDCRQDASGAGVVDPTANRRNEVRPSISPHPSGIPHFFASAASRHCRDGVAAALRAASGPMRKSDRCRDPHECFNSSIANGDQGARRPGTCPTSACRMLANNVPPLRSATNA